ncbi:hypothetical protein OKW23_001405 [Bacilli bacterium PM5-9]|nr:hypothetical protein [Bacilli bacterium PM5-9]
MKIFLDDNRSIDNSEYSVIRTYENCIIVLKTFSNDIDIISLDYDLGGNKTGYDVIEYMYSNNIIPRHINIHSTHKEGSSMIEEYAKTNFSTTTVTTNKIEVL